MEKKYQIFISSTYEDLKNEREQVIKAILEMGHIPVGMEMFSAADEEQWKIIQRQILESDYYVVVTANKYGTISPSGVSYTEMEFDFASENKIPVLGFVLQDKAPWPTEKSETKPKNRASLVAFKKKIQSKLVNFWSNKDELHAKVCIALGKTMTANPRVGWVKSSGNVTNEVMLEISRLSSENSILRKELERIKESEREQSDEVLNVVNILIKNELKIRIRTTAKWEEAKNYPATLLDVFDGVAPKLQIENSISSMAKNLALHISGRTSYYKYWPIGDNRISAWAADFAALELIEPSKKEHPPSDKEQYWTLTDLGRQLLKRSRKIALAKGLGSDND